jgi:hypothetical protein
MKQVAFLGHVILKGGIFVDPSMVQDVLVGMRLRVLAIFRVFLAGSKVYRWIFKDKQTHDRVAREG